MQRNDEVGLCPAHPGPVVRRLIRLGSRVLRRSVGAPSARMLSMWSPAGRQASSALSSEPAAIWQAATALGTEWLLPAFTSTAFRTGS